jgi:hypothetical protein
MAIPETLENMGDANIVERLRAAHAGEGTEFDRFDLIAEAADTISPLAAEVIALRTRVAELEMERASDVEKVSALAIAAMDSERKLAEIAVIADAGAHRKGYDTSDRLAMLDHIATLAQKDPTT